MKFFKKLTTLAIGVLLISTCTHSFAYGFNNIVKAVERIEKEISNSNSFDIPARGKLEVAFSPNEGAERLVIKVIDSATKELLMLTYSFTSAPITEALRRAAHHGVTIRLIADYESNVDLDKTGKYKSPKSIAALSALLNAGVDVRTIKAYAIHHDKVIIANRQTVELGSFNYSAAAASRNSENVLVNWDNPELAAVYLKHFERNYKQSDPFVARY